MLIAMVPFLDVRAFLQSLRRPICVAADCAVRAGAGRNALVGRAWGARLYAIGPTAKLLVLPVLFYHFERSARGMWVLIAFLVSCVLLMAMSWIVAVRSRPLAQATGGAERGIFVKNYIDQSQEFALCAVALAYPIVALLRAKKIWPAVLLIAVSLSFVVNMMFVIVSRTALVTMPIMLAVFALLHLKWRTIVIISCAAIGLAALAWVASPQLRLRSVDVLSANIKNTRTRIRRHRSGCGWSSGRNRCGSLPRRRSSVTAPDRREGFSSGPPPVLKLPPAGRSSAIRTIRR